VSEFFLGIGCNTQALLGFKEITSLCCPWQMEIFFGRLLDSKGYKVCSKPHLQGLMHWFSCWENHIYIYIYIYIPVCRFRGIIKFFKVLYVFICSILHGFNSFNWLKRLFEPIRLELDQFSAQLVDSRSESWHFWKLACGLLGWGTTLRELKVPSGIAPLK